LVVALCWAAVLSVRFESTAAIVAGVATVLALAASLLALRARQQPDWRVGVGPDGLIIIQPGAAAKARSARVRFVSAWVLALDADRPYLLWRDALPADTWRRLQVAARWGQPAASAPLRGRIVRMKN
jgi:hypothetical protein